MKPLLYYTTAELSSMRDEAPEGSPFWRKLVAEIIGRREEERRLRAVNRAPDDDLDEDDLAARHKEDAIRATYASKTPWFIREMELSGFIR